MQEIIGLENINETLSTHYLIYKITNNINGKHYIGQHVTNDPEDLYFGSGKLMLSAISKYNLSSFTKEILFDYDNFDDMNNKEIELVQLSNCWPYDQMSYNLREGGNKKLTEETKIKVSQSIKAGGKVKGKNNPMYGKYHNLSSKLKMSNKNTGTKDKIWICNKNIQENKCVFKNELHQYLIAGWKLGRLNLKQSKNKKSHIGLKWVHNVNLQLETAQNKEKIKFYLDKGWEFGRLPKSLRQKTMNKKLWKWMINKDLKMKCRVYQENIQHFLNLGFKFGSRITRIKN